MTAEFFGSEHLIDELLSRESFPGVIVYREGYRNNTSQKNNPILVAIGPGVTNDEAILLLEEVKKILSHMISR